MSSILNCSVNIQNCMVVVYSSHGPREDFSQRLLFMRERKREKSKMRDRKVCRDNIKEKRKNDLLRHVQSSKIFPWINAR